MPEVFDDARIIAVDGPAAAGKTTASTAIADRLGIQYLESGRAYRFLAYTAICESIDTADSRALGMLCKEVFGLKGKLPDMNADLQYLRDPLVGRVVAQVAQVKEVRVRITDATRRWVEESGPCIIEGRDIGTVVFPQAAVKFYLDAQPQVRALRRRQDEPESSYSQVLEDVLRRDEQDRMRTNSPLRPAIDAIVLDTSELSVCDVIEHMLPSCRIILS